MEEPPDKDNESQDDGILSPTYDIGIPEPELSALCKAGWQQHRQYWVALEAWLWAHRDEHRDEHRAEMAAWREKQKAYRAAQYARARGEGDPDDMLKVADVASLYRVSAQTIRAKIRNGELRATRVDHEEPGRWHYEIRRGDLDPKQLPGREPTTEELRKYYGDDFDGPHSEEDLLTPDQVARLLGQDRQTVYLHIRGGELPATKDSRGHWKVRRGDLPILFQCPPSHKTVEEQARQEAYEEAYRKKYGDKADEPPGGASGSRRPRQGEEIHRRVVRRRKD